MMAEILARVGPPAILNPANAICGDSDELAGLVQVQRDAFALGQLVFLKVNGLVERPRLASMTRTHRTPFARRHVLQLKCRMVALFRLAEPGGVVPGGHFPPVVRRFTVVVTLRIAVFPNGERTTGRDRTKGFRTVVAILAVRPSPENPCADAIVVAGFHDRVTLNARFGLAGRGHAGLSRLSGRGSAFDRDPHARVGNLRTDGCDSSSHEQHGQMAMKHETTASS